MQGEHWFQKVAGDDTYLLQVLSECPDPMCQDINMAQAMHRGVKAGGYPTDEKGVDKCYSVAVLLEQRAYTLSSMLEICRTGLDQLRDAVIVLAERYTADQRELARLTAPAPAFTETNNRATDTRTRAT